LAKDNIDPAPRDPSARRHIAKARSSDTFRDSRNIGRIARGRHWLEELIAGATATPESIAKREKCSIRKANMTVSLAFLAPDLVKAAIEGRLPHGMGLSRLADLPAEWSRQHRILGLPAQ